MTKAIDCVLIVGGLYHDIDFARAELLKLLGEHERIRTRVFEDHASIPSLDAAAMLVTYTCNVIPDAPQIEALEQFLARGGRWLALHGTNSALELKPGAPVRCPELPRAFREMLGAQFMAHPPIGRYKVSPVSDDPLIAGIGPFHVEDEHYLQAYEPGNIPLLKTKFAGRTEIFETQDWPEAEHLVMWRRPRGPGEVLYLTLGHARGRYDMRPLQDFYPLVERGAWQLPVFYELLRRSIRWAAEPGQAPSRSPR